MFTNALLFVPFLVFIGLVILGVVIALIVPIESLSGGDSELNETSNYSGLIIGVFNEQLCEKYVKRMKKDQPIGNDRILPGCGKSHTLKAMNDTIESGVGIPSIFDIIGDVFS